jgi:hypothetical protein
LGRLYPLKITEHFRSSIEFDGSVKVWPMDDKEPQLTAEERFNGKIWFQPHTVESVALVHRDETL